MCLDFIYWPLMKAVWLSSGKGGWVGVGEWVGHTVLSPWQSG